jgi:hypothetical protein
MDWIDDSRRNAFDNAERVRASSRLGAPKKEDHVVSELNLILPDDVKERSLPIGNELILPFDDALAAIATATEREIAVLGFDSGEILDDGFRVADYTGYDRDIEFSGDWSEYVAAINREAERWIVGHRLGKNYGYILTSASQKEFAQCEREKT